MRGSRAPGVARCLAVLSLVDVLAHAIGLRRTFAVVRRLAPQPAADGTEARLIESTVHSLTTAAAFYPRRALCLEQSLTLLLLLRRRGVPAELRIGVQPRPFYAHAWVEVDGRPVREQEDLPLNYVAFPSLGV